MRRLASSKSYRIVNAKQGLDSSLAACRRISMGCHAWPALLTLGLCFLAGCASRHVDDLPLSATARVDKEPYLTVESAIAIVRHEIESHGADPDVWDYSAHRCRYPLDAPPGSDGYGEGWRVIANLIVHPDKAEDDRFVPGNRTTYTLNNQGKILWSQP
ncbi:MAG: hypothetical protein JWO94_292 [Verrucomicrobiaceae bacterium]|nr:hypothetical protein [Verrucomicrobiaceae bacterium]